MDGFFLFINIILIIIGAVMGSSINKHSFSGKNITEDIEKVQTKNTFGIIILFFVLFTSGLSIHYGLQLYHEVNFIVVLLIIEALVGFIYIIKSFSKRTEIPKLAQEAKDKVDKIEVWKQEQRDKVKQQNLEEEKYVAETFGNYDKVIFTDANEVTGYKGWKNALYVKATDQKIMINSRVIPFSNVISCKVEDNSHVKSKQVGTSNSTTTTDNGNMVGRAVVGGLLAGGAGAVIGGATAKKETKSTINTTTVSRTCHNYTIIVNIKDVLEPVCKIECGSNLTLVNEIEGTINAIIENK